MNGGLTETRLHKVWDKTQTTLLMNNLTPILPNYKETKARLRLRHMYIHHDKTNTKLNQIYMSETRTKPKCFLNERDQMSRIVWFQDYEWTKNFVRGIINIMKLSWLYVSWWVEVHDIHCLINSKVFWRATVSNYSMSHFISLLVHFYFSKLTLDDF